MIRLLAEFEGLVVQYCNIEDIRTLLEIDLGSRLGPG